MVRIAGLPGGIPNPELDLRFLEFTLQGKALGVDGKVALAPPPAPTDLLSETGGGGWTFWAVAIVGILALAFFAVAGAAVLVARQKAKVAPAPKPQAQPATESIHLACATCGKRLKVKAALRGKKVKCPGCGENTRVPASDTHVKNKTAQ
jgi:predicted RNA-binding Zn-ribbon protein involved in translation (DUF1610 family)